MSQTIELLKRVLDEYGHTEEMGLLPNVSRERGVWYTEPATHYCLRTEKGRLLNDIYEYLFKNKHIKQHKFK